MEHGMAKL